MPMGQLFLMVTISYSTFTGRDQGTIYSIFLTFSLIRTSATLMRRICAREYTIQILTRRSSTGTGHSYDARRSPTSSR